MKEESQIDEMRAAVRGDRERAEEARRRSTENVLALIETPEPKAVERQEPPPRLRLLGRLFGR